MLYKVVLVSTVEQSASATCLQPHVPLFFLDWLPIYANTEHRVEFPVLHSKFPLIIYFIHNSVYMPGGGHGTHSSLLAWRSHVTEEPHSLVHGVTETRTRPRDRHGT